MWRRVVTVSEATYRQLALEDPDGQWELYCGKLRQKPPMTASHGQITMRLIIQLASQFDEDEFTIRTNHGRTRVSAQTYYVPDVCVIPMELVRPLLHRTNALDAYAEPLPFVVEVWSPSTGDFDVDTKLPDYQRRGDLEIWRVHPYDQTVTVWRRQPDGSYAESTFTSGHIQLSGLPNVTIDVDALFA
jgi:Uma2 family endonuclease